METIQILDVVLETKTFDSTADFNIKSVEVFDTAIEDLGENFTRGIDTVTRAIYETADIAFASPAAISKAPQQH